jgi:hypothetical protein
MPFISSHTVDFTNTLRSDPLNSARPTGGDIGDDTVGTDMRAHSSRRARADPSFDRGIPDSYALSLCACHTEPPTFRLRILYSDIVGMRIEPAVGAIPLLQI